LRRPDWHSLDGAWDFAFDPEDVGLSLDWRDPDTAFPETIIVPYPWQSARSGLGSWVPETYVRGEGPAGGGIGWYRRRFQIPDEWTGKRLTLVVGAAYWHTTAWVDGVFAGEHDGGFEPIAVDLSPFVDGDSELTLTLRVWAPDDTDEYPHGKN